MIKDIISYITKGGLPFILLCFAIIFNHRMGYITIIGVFSIMVFATITIKTKLDRGGILILLYTLFYIFLSYINGVSYSMSTLVLYAIAPFIFYQYGINIVSRFKSQNYIMVAWLIVIFCYCLDIFVVTLNSIIQTGQIINPTREFMFSEGSDSSQLSATLVGLSMDIGMIGFPMFLLAKNNIIRVSFFLLFLLSLITTFSLLNRTGIFVAALCFISVIGYKSRKDYKLFTISVLCISILIGLLFYFEIINTELIEFYNERNEDLSTMGSRTDRWSEALRLLFYSPIGWVNGNFTYYVHNMWLDIARISGIIPFLFLVYITMDSFRNAVSLVKQYESPLEYMILGLNVCFFLSCFVEPIYGGTHFMLYCMLWGTSVGLLKR